MERQESTSERARALASHGTSLRLSTGMCVLANKKI